MSGKKKFSKGQATVAVRRILAQYQIDLTQMNFTANAKSLYFSGTLKKISGKDCQPQELMNMVAELSKLGRIRSDMDNWVLSNDSVHYTGKRDKKEKKHGTDGTKADKEAA